MVKKSWTFLFFSLSICLILGGIMLFRSRASKTNAPEQDSLGAVMRLQACPPQSNSPNCYTAIPPTPVPPTAVPPTSVPPTAVPQNPTLIIPDSGDHPNIRASKTALAAGTVYWPSPIANLPSVTSPPIGSGNPQDPGSGEVSTSTVEAPRPTPQTEDGSGGNTFLIITVVFLLGIGILAFLLRR